MVETQVQKIIRLAEAEVGYHEGRTGSNWNNHQKYSPAVPGLEWSQNQAWCATFMSWLAMKADLTELYPRSASCDVSGKWFKDRDRWSEYPAIGAQVFYGKPSDLNHTGLVINYDDTYLYTIEGNTNTSGSAQGDGVYRQKRVRRSNNVVGYGYPKFTAGIQTADPDPKWKKANAAKPKPPVVDKPATEAPVTDPGKVMVDTVFGVDLSHYQLDNGFDLSLLKKQEYHFVILKCTEGVGWHDGTYARALAKAKSLGLMVGAYHFLEHGNATRQAQNLADHIVDKKVPVYIDIESSATSPRKEDWVAFKDAAEKLGLTVKGKYLTSSYWASIGSPSLKGPLVLWRAAYPSSEHKYGSVLYPGNNYKRWEPFGGQTPTLWQFASTGKIDGYRGNVDLNAFRGNLDALKKANLFLDYSAPAPVAKKAAGKKVAAKKPTTTKQAAPEPKTKPKTTDFRVHLVPGQKIRSFTEVKEDMALVLEKTFGHSAVVFNTERQNDQFLKAVSDGLGEGWTRVIDNENTIAYGSNWEAASRPTATLLAKEDPSMAGVSPNRYLNRVPLVNRLMPDTTVAMKGTHLLSEAYCIHTKVRGRAWREKMWPISMADVMTSLVRDFKAGVPQVLAGDFNTGVYFNGDQLFAMLKDKFGDKVVHVHNSQLDHIFVISTDTVKLSEVGVEVTTNNMSDHDMVTAKIRMELL